VRPVFSLHVGIDLGTANILLYVQGRGIVAREPSVVALDRNAGKVLAVGSEALKMLGKTPSHIVAVRPLRDGVIANYDVTLTMLRHFLRLVSKLRRPTATICVPAGVTSVERRAVREAALAAGASRAWLIEEPVAAALGAGIDMKRPGGTMVVDLGGGTTDIAVLSMGSAVVSESVRVAGDRLDESISRMLRRSHNLMVGEQTAESLKIELGSAVPVAESRQMEVRGRDLVNGLPRTVLVGSQEVQEALSEPIGSILGAVRGVLERTPPELAADLLDQGVVLTGGGALLSGLDDLLHQATGLPVRVAEDPITCVALGTGMADPRNL